MSAAQPGGRASTRLALVLAAGAALLAFLLQGRVGFNLQDESFLWYGELRTLAGETPLLDFRSYDPGRYWWTALCSTLFGDGLVGLRAATWLFAAFGLAAGLCALRRVLPRPWELALAAALLAVWMFPPWKLYEPSIALVGVLCATRFLESPTNSRALQLGLWTGLAAVFARNFGAYGGAAAACVLGVSAWRDGRAGFFGRFAALCGGTLLGYLPVLAACAFVDGFARAFVDSILFYLRQDSLNAALAVPWPWSADYANLQPQAALVAAAVGTGFVLLWLVPVAAIVLAARSRSAAAPLALGAGLVALFASHHASVRSDVFHLAQVWGAVALAAVGLAATTKSSRPRRIALVSLLALGLAAVGARQPAWRRVMQPHEEVEVRGETLLLPKAEAASLRTLVELLRAHVPPDARIWIGPRFLGLYCVLDRRAPTWEIYPAFAGSESDQRRMLEELAQVDWILHDARAIGRDEEMVLERSHPLVWQELQRSFEPAGVQGLPASLLFLRRRK